MAKPKLKRVVRKRREKKLVERGAAHIRSSFNNTIVTITDTAGNTFTKSSTSKQTITRNISKNMPAFEVVTTESDPSSPVPSNQIWYTSTDGKIVTPTRTASFGAKITSNIYENGKGVLASSL